MIFLLCAYQQLDQDKEPRPNQPHDAPKEEEPVGNEERRDRQSQYGPNFEGPPPVAKKNGLTPKLLADQTCSK
jgi:hypothetical protein